KAKIVRKFPDNLVSPWLVALKRPEADLQRQAAVTIAVAHKKGVPGLEVTVVPLLEVLEKPDHHRLARLAAARALVELDDRQVGPCLGPDSHGRLRVRGPAASSEHAR